MPDFQIPISYVVSASAVTPSLSLAPLQTGTILLLTDEQPVNPIDGDYMIARTASAVVNQYGTNSETAKQAQIIFSQNPNLLLGNGYLIVANFKNDGSTIIPATAGYLTLPDITSNIDNFKAVEQGVLNVSIDGAIKELTALDFAGINSVEDIAHYLQVKLPETTITVQNEQIVITSDSKGTNSTVVLAPFENPPVLKPEVPATQGFLTTENIVNNIANLKTVTNGTIPLNLNGTEANIISLNFSTLEESATLQDVIAIIQAAITAGNIENLTVLADTAGTGLVFASSTYGANSTVTYNSEYTPTEDTNLGGATYFDLAEAVATAGTNTVPAVIAPDIYGASYLNGSQAVSTPGKNQEIITTPGETLVQAISRMAGKIYFEGILTTRNLSDIEVIEASNLVQSMQNRVFPLPASSTAALANDGLFSKTLSNTKTKNLLYTYGATDAEAALNSRLFAAAYLSRAFSVNYSGSNTTLTMNLKDLTGILADTNINETILAQCEKMGADCYVSIEGLPKVISNSQSGMYFDQVLNQIWFVNAIQRAVFNALAATRTKIPQTEAGMEKIRTAIRGVCNQAVINGYLAPGTWNGSDTFGDYEDFHRNIREFGYYEYHPPISEQAQAEREQRKAPLWQIAGKEAGAVHSANILIYVEP